MTVSGEAFSRRLESYSDDTFRLITKFEVSKEYFHKAMKIVKTTDTEEEVVEKLQKLKEELDKKTSH